MPMAGIKTRTFPGFIGAYLTEDHRHVAIRYANRLTDASRMGKHRELWRDGEWYYIVPVPGYFWQDIHYILEGKHSLISDRARGRIIASLEQRTLKAQPDREQEKQLFQDIRQSKHPIYYCYFHNGPRHIYPKYVGAIYPPGHPLRESLRRQLERELEKDIDTNEELWTAPDLYTETFYEQQEHGELDRILSQLGIDYYRGPEGEL